MSCLTYGGLCARYVFAKVVCELMLERLPLSDRDRAYLLAQHADLVSATTQLAPLGRLRNRRRDFGLGRVYLYLTYRLVRQDLYTLGRRFAFPVDIPA